MFTTAFDGIDVYGEKCAKIDDLNVSCNMHYYCVMSICSFTIFMLKLILFVDPIQLLGLYPLQLESPTLLLVISPPFLGSPMSLQIESCWYSG